MPKYIEVPKVDENKERAKKKISFLLVLVSVCITAGVGFTIAGFWVWWCLFVSLVCELVVPFAMLYAFKIAMEYRNVKGTGKSTK